MSQSLKAAVSFDDGAPLEFRDLDLESPRPSEMLVQVAFTGICGTDIKAAKGVMGAHKPAVLGHEGVGVVREVGSAVSRFAPGDRILMAFASCGVCPSCASARPSYCRDARALNMNAERADHSTAYVDGQIHSHFFGQSSFATHCLAIERNCVPVPDDIPLWVAAAMGCGVITGAGSVFNVLNVRPGSSIVIFGAGAVGLSAAMAAKIAGASAIVLVDPVPSRLLTALEVGATHAFNAADPDLLNAIRGVTGQGMDYAVEASGNTEAFVSALAALGIGGAIAVAGAAGDVEGAFRWRDLMLRGITIRGLVEGDANPPVFVPRLMQYYREGRFPVEALVRRYDFDDINQAMADAASGLTIKPVLNIGPDPLFG